MHVKPKDCLLPLTWWTFHEVWFFNIYFVMWQNFEILGSQIKVEWIINIVGVLTSLWCCTPKVENLNLLIKGQIAHQKGSPLMIFLQMKQISLMKIIVCWKQMVISMFMTLNDGMLINILPYFWKLNNFVMWLFPFCVMMNGFFTMGVGWCLFVFWQVSKRG